MFDLDRFIVESEAAMATDKGRDVVRELLSAAISDPAEMIAVFGKSKFAGVQALHRHSGTGKAVIVTPPQR